MRVRPKRSGGYSRYRVVLESTCSDLARWYTIGFRSGANNGGICGNTGDAIVEELEFDRSLFDFERAAWNPPQIGAQCAIREVYPMTETGG